MAEDEEMALALAGMQRLAEVVGEREKQLVCAGAPSDRVGATLCADAGAWSSCVFVPNATICPRARLIERHDRWKRHLDAAGAPDKNVEVLLAHARLYDAARIEQRPPVRVVTAYLRRRRLQLDVPAARGALTGSERFLFLAGTMRFGKSTAACLAIAERGGWYIQAPEIRPGFDERRAIAARVLVVDQWGTEHQGDSDWAIKQLSHVVKSRYEYKRDTIGCGNVRGLRAQFEQLYGPVVAKVLNEGGAWFEFKGTP
jgi:hypothetical protein